MDRTGFRTFPWETAAGPDAMADLPTDTPRIRLLAAEPPAASLAAAFAAEGLVVERWDDAGPIAEAPPALAVIAALPTGDEGPALLAALRSAGARTVLLLAPAEMERLEACYRAGADVVLPASADPRHVVLQGLALLALLHPDSPPMRVGAARFDPAARRLLLADGPIRLTEAETRILQMLVDGRGSHVSREAISQSVFRIPYDRFDRRIDVHISNLRRKLRDNAVGAVIDTSRLGGFRLAPLPPPGALTVGS